MSAQWWARYDEQPDKQCDVCRLVKAAREFRPAHNGSHVCRACPKRSPEARSAQRRRIARRNGVSYRTDAERRRDGTRAKDAERGKALIRRLLKKVAADSVKRLKDQKRRAGGPALSQHPAAVAWRERYNTDPAFRLAQATRTRARKLRKCSGVTMIDDGTVLPEIFAEHSECPYCGIDMPMSRATVDHMVPLTKGGIHSNRNVIACCFTCNTRKGNKDFDVWVSSLPAGRRAVVEVAVARRAAVGTSSHVPSQRVCKLAVSLDTRPIYLGLT